MQQNTDLERIREWMKEKGLRPVDVARGMGWGEKYVYVHNMLSGTRSLSDGFKLDLILSYPETADLFRHTNGAASVAPIIAQSPALVNEP